MATITMHKNRTRLSGYCAFATSVRTYVLKAYNKHRSLFRKYSLKDGELMQKNDNVCYADIEPMVLFASEEAAKKMICEAFETNFCGCYDGGVFTYISPTDLDIAMRTILTKNLEREFDRLENGLDVSGVVERAVEDDATALGMNKNSLLPCVVLYCLLKLGALNYFKYRELIRFSFSLN